MPLKKRPIFVHLGNVGDPEFFRRGPGADKTRKFAERFPQVDFVGVDLRAVEPTTKNWVQHQADFLTGLQKLEDNSVNHISSDLALGYYDAKGACDDFWKYTEQVLKLAKRKLKQGGKLRISVSENRKKIILLIKQLGFSSIEVRPFSREEYNRTSWTQQLPGLIQITAIK